MKPTVAVDIDDVLVPHEVHLAKWYRRHIDPRYPHDDMRQLGLHRLSERQRQHVIEIMNAFLESADFLDIPPHPGASEALQKLGREYELVVLTGRPGVARPTTETWLQRHFPAVFSDVHYANPHHGWATLSSVSKRELCSRSGAGYIIDDDERHIRDVSSAGTSGILFGTYSWNRVEELPPNTVRAEDWDEVLEVLL